MMTCLEPLDAARGAKAAVEIFSLIAVGSGRRRQPFAFNGKQRLIFRILAAFDPDNRSARRHRKIDRSSAVGVVRFFALELQKIPSRGMTDRACQARAKLRSEEHTSVLQSLMRISYAVFCLKKKNT